MKMTVIYLTYLLVIMCSYASCRTKGLDSIISELVELNKVAGKSSESISVLVSRISTSIETVRDREEKFYRGMKQTCKSGKQILNGFIDKLKADLVEMNVSINQSKDKAEQARKSQKGYKKQIDGIKANIIDLEKKIEKEWEKYKNFAKENNEKLITIKYVKDLITDELLAKHKSGSGSGKKTGSGAIKKSTYKGRSNRKLQKKSLIIVKKSVSKKKGSISGKKSKGIKPTKSRKYSRSKGKSFIQLNTEEFAQKVDDLKFMLNGLSAKESVYSAMAATLLQVAENKGFSDKRLLSKLIEILGKLQKNLKKFAVDFKISQKRIIKDIKASSKAAKTQIRAVLNMYKEAASISAESANFIAASLKNKKSIESTIERKMIQFRHWEKICKYQDKLRKDTFNWRTGLFQRLNKITALVGRKALA